MASVEKKPMITYARAENAISKYCPSELEISYDDILFLIDDTIFGSGKIGLLVTKDYICGKEDFSEPFYFDTDDVIKIEFKKAFLGGTNVLINGQKVMNLKIEYSSLSMSGDALLRIIFQTKDKDEEYEDEDEDENIDEEYLEDEYDEEQDEEIGQETIPIHTIRVGDIKKGLGITKRNEKSSFQLYRQLRYMDNERPFADLLIHLLNRKRADISAQQLRSDPLAVAYKFYIDNTIKMRNYVEKRAKYKYLLNDIATIEFLYHSINLFKLASLGFKGRKIENVERQISSSIHRLILDIKNPHMIYTALKDTNTDQQIQQYQVAQYGNNLFNLGDASINMRAIRDKDSLANLFYQRLFLSNYKGKTCMPNIGIELEESIEFILKDFEFLGSAFDVNDDYALFYLIRLIVSDDKNSIPKKFAIEELSKDAEEYEINHQFAEYIKNNNL